MLQKLGCRVDLAVDRQTASLRAVGPAGPGSQGWPPPSLRLVWPVRLSVDVETGPRCVGRLSLQRCHLPVPPSLHGVSWAQRFGGTMDTPTPRRIPPRFVAFARRYHPDTCGSLRRTPGATYAPSRTRWSRKPGWPSLRLVWPVRIRCRGDGTQPRCVAQRCHLPVPPSLHGVSWAQFPRFGGTMRHSDSSPPIPPRFVAFARRYHPSTCGSLRRTPGATSTASGLVSRCPRPGGL